VLPNGELTHEYPAASGGKGRPPRSSMLAVAGAPRSRIMVVPAHLQTAADFPAAQIGSFFPLKFAQYPLHLGHQQQRYSRVFQKRVEQTRRLEPLTVVIDEVRWPGPPRVPLPVALHPGVRLGPHPLFELKRLAAFLNPARQPGPFPQQCLMRHFNHGIFPGAAVTHQQARFLRALDHAERRGVALPDQLALAKTRRGVVLVHSYQPGKDPLQCFLAILPERLQRRIGPPRDGAAQPAKRRAIVVATSMRRVVAQVW